MDAHTKSANATAIAITQVADAALYFDNVVPIGGLLESIYRMRLLWKEPLDPEALFRHTALTPDVQEQLLPPRLRNSEEFCVEREAMFLSEVEEIHRWQRCYKPGRVIINRDLDLWFRHIRTLVRKFGLTDVPVIAHDDLLPLSQSSRTECCFAATMTSLQLVDARKLSWDHILEFRKDPQSRLKLRRLRLLFAENYAGKERLYIEDDLQRRLDDYSRVVKEWGFETRAHVLSMLLRSKWLAGGAGGSIICALAGAPLTSLAAASGGVVVEAANLVLEVVKRRHVLAKLTRENPVSYISDVANITTHKACP